MNDFHKQYGDINQLTDNKLDRKYVELQITTDTIGRAEVPYAADKILNCTVRSNSYIGIPRFKDGNTTSLLYVYEVGTMKPVPNISITVAIRYIE